MVARVDGGEFGVLASGVAVDQTADLARRLRAAVSCAKIDHEGSDVSDFVSISISIAVTMASTETDVVRLLKNADDSLYRAKREGRNQIYAGSI